MRHHPKMVFFSPSAGCMVHAGQIRLPSLTDDAPAPNSMFGRARASWACGFAFALLLGSFADDGDPSHMAGRARYSKPTYVHAMKQSVRWTALLNIPGLTVMIALRSGMIFFPALLCADLGKSRVGGPWISNKIIPDPSHLIFDLYQIRSYTRILS
jgi:hypothetical protein